MFTVVFTAGFHDGCISSVIKKQVLDEEELRPVLIYRIKYNDGDEEGKSLISNHENCFESNDNL